MQIQFFGRGNTQIIQQEIAQSFARLLVTTSDALKQRTFRSTEVSDYLFGKIDQIITQLNEKEGNAHTISRFIVYPFKAIAIPEHLQESGYIRSMIDTLSIIALADCSFDFVEDHINVKIGEKHTFGIYYTQGQLDLADSYTRILKNLSVQKVALPQAFVCIPLDTSGAYLLDQTKINNIVTSIVGESTYIKPIKDGNPKCLSLSSYIIQEAATVLEAKNHIRRALGLTEHN